MRTKMINSWVTFALLAAVAVSCRSSEAESDLQGRCEVQVQVLQERLSPIKPTVDSLADKTTIGRFSLGFHYPSAHVGEFSRMGLSDCDGVREFLSVLNSVATATIALEDDFEQLESFYLVSRYDLAQITDWGYIWYKTALELQPLQFRQCIHLAQLLISTDQGLEFLTMQEVQNRFGDETDDILRASVKATFGEEVYVGVSSPAYSTVMVLKLAGKGWPMTYRDIRAFEVYSDTVWNAFSQMDTGDAPTMIAYAMSWFPIIMDYGWSAVVEDLEAMVCSSDSPPVQSRELYRLARQRVLESRLWEDEDGYHELPPTMSAFCRQVRQENL